MVCSERLRALAFISLVAACSFDRSALDRLRCESNDDCGAGTYCSEGYCLSNEQRQDMGPDTAPDLTPDMCIPAGDDDGDGFDDVCADNCPGLANPEQTDSDGDRAGNDCDCVANNPGYASTVINDLFNSDTGALTPLSGSWMISGGFLLQTAADGEALDWVPGASSNAHNIQANLTIGASGTGAMGHNAAGLLVRAEGLTATDGTAYLCGVDLLPSPRVWLARADFTAGTVTELDGTDFPYESATSNWMARFHFLRFEAQTDEMTCTLCNGAITPVCSSQLADAIATDGTHTMGSVGLFTLGAAANFGFVRACGDVP